MILIKDGNELKTVSVSFPDKEEYIGIPREVDSSGTFKLSTDTEYIFPKSATSVSSYAFYNAFAFRSNLTKVDFSSLISISGSFTFECAFSNCTSLTDVDFSNLTTADYQSYVFSYCFNVCTKLSSITFDNLNSIKSGYIFQYAFASCSSLKEIRFPALNSNSFGSYTNQFYYMLNGVSGCTVHFPASIKSTIGSWSDITSGFGGTNTKVLFDINGATINFIITSSGDLTYYIGNEEVESGVTIPLDDTNYTIIGNEGIITNTLTSLQENEIVNINKDLTTTSFNTITISTDQSDCTVTFTINGININPTSSSGSNYILNILSDSSETISYSVKKKGYTTVKGTLTYSGSDITENITMVARSTNVDITLVPSGITYGWQETTVTNPTTLSMYESTNYNIDNSYSVMKVTFSGYTSFTCYINSYAESSYDYTIASKLDVSAYPTSDSDTNAYANTKSKQYNPTTFNTTNWTTVTFSDITTDEHYFYIVYRKDSSAKSNNDRGYFIIDENQ